MKQVRYAWLLVLMVLRNIRWTVILAFFGGERPWPVLDFQMMLTARKAGWDPTENSIHKQLILDRVRESAATEIMQRFIEPDDVILELGANIGYYVLIEARILSEKGYVYAVEPSPDNVLMLKKNVELNGFKQIEIFNMAMSNRVGTAPMYVGAACNLHSLVEHPDRPERASIEVKTDLVDHFLEDKRPISFLRMDVEGYETIILEGMTKTLASPSLKKMFIEIHPMVIESDQMQRFFQTLQEAGFALEAAISRDNWQRTVLGHCRVEYLTLAALAQDPRVLAKAHAFECFFRRD